MFNLSSILPPTRTPPHPATGSHTPDMKADKEIPPLLLLPDGESGLWVSLCVPGNLEGFETRCWFWQSYLFSLWGWNDLHTSFLVWK